MLTIVKLLAKGLIILGKASLSVRAKHPNYIDPFFTFYRAPTLPCAWSGVAGQGQSPYTDQDVKPEDGSASQNGPGGSSSGSAVGVAAGYSPLALGTETIGSIMLPSTRAALYAVKPTQRPNALAGVIPTTDAMDTVGPMAKCTRDIATLLDILIPSDSSFCDNLGATWSDLKVGVLEPKIWKWPQYLAPLDEVSQEQITQEIEAANNKISFSARKFTTVQLESPATLQNEEGEGPFHIMEADFRDQINAYFESLEDSQVRSLKELIQFNLDHADREMPSDLGKDSQILLLRAQENTKPKASRDELLAFLRLKSGPEGIDRVLDANNLDVILCPADSEINIYTTLNTYRADSYHLTVGYPSAHMPLSYLKLNGRPFGMIAIAKAGQEHILIKVMAAWERTFPPRKPPVMDSFARGRL
ncbi:hypothetical protein LTR84_004844 [Exophiala bonariae]|uniref:Amidase domain-containing protein n=1 Tax=Exophiala bonariae TaxID=1690606 RepID=A0AAV9NNC1_9EURO|nr:hypothetical protein LTR84_004844 [Exophiala bonariae]